MTDSYGGSDNACSWQTTDRLLKCLSYSFSEIRHLGAIHRDIILYAYGSMLS